LTAAIAEQVEGGEIRSGTPAYMAPEQLAGKEVTAQSDIYSLGLVLYEIFTGKRAFSAENIGELVRARAESKISRPSTLVKDLDPLIERVILRCLQPEPSDRPSDALAVSAALPGGDPLAAALAAGETPSPAMVAAAGETEGLNPKLAMACFAAALLALLLGSWFGSRLSAVERMPLEQSPEVLRQRAHDIIARLGYDAHSAARCVPARPVRSIASHFDVNAPGCSLRDKQFEVRSELSSTYPRASASRISR